MRRAAKIDATQNSIVDALLRAGCRVQSLATVGMGCPDLLVKGPHGLMLLEVKSPGGGLTWQQEKWHQHWGTDGVAIVQTPAQALAAMGLGEQ